MNGYQKKRIIEALDNLEHLSDWENDFMLSIANKGDDDELSEKQNSIINRIGEKLGAL